MVRFFVGMEVDGKTSRNFKSDEVVLSAPDDYAGLPFKTREITRWATTKAVSHAFLCDTDTFVKPKKLLECGFEQADYMGKISKPIGERFSYEDVDRAGQKHVYDRAFPWASGGFGYFLSKGACFEVSDQYPAGMWAEDFWVGQVMGEQAAQGYAVIEDVPAGTYSFHFPQGKYGSQYDPKFKWMEQMYEENK
ncbi:Uncharacterised protein [uncultured archaeon]|nr:Uncharacterised protein [uncultured archaeon]